jgi:WD40 repeat protein
MKPINFGWLATATMAMFVLAATPALPEDLPPPEPLLRIDTGMHEGSIRRIGVDAACRRMVTGAEDKTARLWELPQNGVGDPKLLHVLRVPIGTGKDGEVYAVALSSDGRFVAAGGWDVFGEQTHDNGVYIFDAETGKLLRRLGKLTKVIGHLTFSPDGKYLAATLWREGLRVWETTGWRLVREDKDYGGESYGAAFGPGGELYTVAFDGSLRRYGPGFSLEAKVKTLGGKEPFSVAVHPKGDRVAVGFNDSAAVEVYDTMDLKRLFAAETSGVNNAHLSSVAWSSDGALLYAGGRDPNDKDNRLRIWDQEGHGKGRDVNVGRYSTITQLLPCPEAIAVAAAYPAFGLITENGERRVWQEAAGPVMSEKIGANFPVSNDGSKVLFGLEVGGNRPVLFNLAAGRLTEDAKPGGGLFVPDTKSLKLADWKDNEKPKLSGKPLELQQYELSRSVAIAPDHRSFVLGTDWWLRAYSKDGKELLWSIAAPSGADGVNIPHDGKFVVAAYGDGTIRWHRLSDGKEVLALFVNAKTREWVLWTPQGYYTSSVNGDQMVGWHLNKGWKQAGEFVTAARLKKHLYRPDIVKRAFELADAEAAVREAGLSGFKLADLASHTPPEFRIVDPGDKTHAAKSPVAVKLDLAATDDPVSGFDITVNGRQVTTRDVRDLDKSTAATRTRTLNIPLERGENRIKVVAHNSVGDSVQDLLVFLDSEGVLDKKGKLFILAIGVDKYTKLGPKDALNFAGADAGLIVETLASKAGPLHTDVKIELLASGGMMSPTRGNIEDALALFRQAGPEDTSILFIAGHGDNDGPDYLFLPEDAEWKDGHWRPSSTVNWQILQHALQTAQGRRIMFVDTCHSGGAYNPRLIKDSVDANIIVFSATDEVTLAHEKGEIGHGVFTYALAKGISGEADMFKDGTISILGLATYVSNQVRRITNDAQEPTYNVSGSKDFVLAKH